MSFTSIGYAGTVEDGEWARMAPHVGGSEYGVLGTGFWRASIGSGTRQLQLTAGYGWGKGIFDESSTPETLTLASVPTGSRWDLIVARRNWATKTTQFVVIPGGSARAIPARNTAAGFTDDQPLWLARVQADRTLVQEIVDLRVFPRMGGAIAFDELVLSYLSGSGTQILIGGTLHQSNVVGGSTKWTRTPMGDSGWITSGISVTASTASGFKVGDYQFRDQQDRVSGFVDVTRTGDSIVFDNTADVPNDPSVCVIESAYRPSGFPRPVLMRGIGSIDFAAQINTAGVVSVTHAQRAGAVIAKNASFRLYFDFPR